MGIPHLCKHYCIIYAALNNSRQDAVVSGSQKKDLIVYTDMMAACLKEVSLA